MSKDLTFHVGNLSSMFVLVTGDQLVVNSYEPMKASQKWGMEGTLLRWHGASAEERQVVGVKPPIGPQEICLHVGPLDTLHGTQWTKEFLYTTM